MSEIVLLKLGRIVLFFFFVNFSSSRDNIILWIVHSRLCFSQVSHYDVNDKS